MSDNADVNKNSTSFLNNLSAEYKLDKEGGLKARLFRMKDFDNIIDGELFKSGAGVLYNKALNRQRDSLDRSLEMEAEGNVVYRSNNQIGPDASVSLSKNNLFGRGDVFTTKVKGAYFWNQRSPEEYMSPEDIQALLKAFNLPRMYSSKLDAATFLNQIALGTGAGLRLDYESIVVRLDLGVAIHAPFDTGRTGYYNIPNFWRDGLKLNFGIGYPF